MKKVKLVVVQGKNEGKTITLPGPVFRIGRGETCHLRPNSERVSREHAEIRISDGDVVVRDLGSRNGTLVNGKAITEPIALRHQDSVQVGPLTFAVSIVDAHPSEVRPVPLDPNQVPEGEASDSWQIADIISPSASSSGGDTVLIPAFTSPPAASAGDSQLGPTDASDEEYERYDDAEGAEQARKAARGSDAPKPKPSKSAKSGDAASEILRKIMSRRQSSK
jgi:pSer/pThr/pTyr-binding forkhead associated (FHA) protein